MSRTKKCLAMLLMTMACSLQADAQWKNLLKKVTTDAVTSATETGGAGDVLNGITAKLLGTNKLTTKNLVGTWTYDEPCVAFESENLLASVGSSLASKKVQETLNKQLSRLGFTAGKLAFTLKSDSIGVVSMNGKKVEVNWSVSGSGLLLSFPLSKKSVHVNAKVTGNSLQLAMNAEKLLTLATAITDKADTVSETLGTLSTLAKNVKGMYIGLTFKK